MKNSTSKRTFSLITGIAITIAVISFSGCIKEYEQGPAISLKGHKARLKGLWQMETVESGFPSDYYPYTTWTYEFLKDGTWIETRDTNTYKGTWQFSEDSKYLQLKYNEGARVWHKYANGNPYSSYILTANTNNKILRLTKDELWADFEYFENRHLKKK